MSMNNTFTVEHPKTAIPTWGVPIFICVGLLTGTLILTAMYHRSKKNRKKHNETHYEAQFTIPIIQPHQPIEDINAAIIQPSDDNYLNPSLYERENDECAPGVPYTGQSRLCFSIGYDKDSEKLTVTLIRATRLMPKGTNITATPYIKLCLLPDKRRKIQSRIQHRTSNPEFNECFVFIVPEHELHTRTLRLTICDFDRFSRQQVIGHVTYPLKDVESITEKKEIWMDIIGEEETKPTFPKGELLFCLQFLPTISRLTIVVMKARNLQLEGETSELYAYVKISMVLGGKTVKKKKTSVSKRSNNPVYNEAFAFTIPPDCLSRVSFILSVISAPRLGGQKKLIGRCVVGPYMYSTGAGLVHWNDMLQSTRSAVAQWHSLI